MAGNKDDGSDGFGEVKERIQQSVEEGGVEPSVEVDGKTYVRTGVPGFDDLFEHGIPEGSPVILAGGSGSGKTVFALQILAYHASQGEKCFYMSFEESVEALKEHMTDFGWDADGLIESGNLVIKTISPFEVTQKIEARKKKSSDPLFPIYDPDIPPKDFDPKYVVVDSLSAIATAFPSMDKQAYRRYVDDFFGFFEEMDATSFLITETRQEPEVFSPTGVEEFLADGVIVLYNFRRGDSRERGVEVLKMRGARHVQKIVAMQITDEGVNVYPQQEIFGALDDR